MSDSISTTRRRRPWACSSGHNHQTRTKAALCEAERIIQWWRDRPAWVVTFEQARTKWRPIPDDERDPLEARVERGRIDWGAVWRGFAVPALGGAAAVAFIVALVGVGGAIEHAIVQLVASGHDAYLAAALAAAVLVGVSVPVVRRPRVRKALHWLREAYS